MKSRVARRQLAWLAAASAVLWACDAWIAWDEMFTRASIGVDAKGWNGGDAALSAPLPGGRSVFLFGDSYVTSVGSDGRRVQLDPRLDPWEQLRHVVFGNTIGVTSTRTPGADHIAFYARQRAGGAGAGQTMDITRVPGVSFAGAAQFFDHASLGLTPIAGRYFWPIGAECYDCDGANARLLVAFSEWEVCDPSQNPDRNVCAPLCGLTGTSVGVCTQGVALKANVIAKFANVDQPPSAWTRDGAALRLARDNSQIQWGGSFVVEGEGNQRRIHVYGLRATGELFVRRTTLADLTSGTEAQWTVWRRVWGVDRWTTGTSPMRAVASGVPTYYSIDRLTRNGSTRYLLTYSQLGHKLFARVSGATPNSSTEAASWPGESETTPTLDLMSIESSIRSTVSGLVAADQCSPDTSGPVPSLRHCGISYHGLAHAEHASSDELGPSTIPTSYIVTYGPNPFFDPGQPEVPGNPRFGSQDTRYYRPRFTYLDLTKLEPWCTSDCWRGMLHQYVAPALSAYEFDITHVSNGRRFYAALTPQAGSPSMRVDYLNGASVLRTDTCAPAAAPVCDAAPPAGAKVARVVLSGAAGASALMLRVHHAGTR